MYKSNTTVTEKVIKKAANEVLAAFKEGHVAGASEALHPYAFYVKHIEAELKSKIPAIWLERIIGSVPSHRKS